MRAAMVGARGSHGTGPRLSPARPPASPRAHQLVVKQAAARCAARLLARLTPAAAAATRAQPPAAGWPALSADAEAAALAAGADAEPARCALRAALGSLVTPDVDDAVRVVGLHALKTLARGWAAEPAARGALLGAVGGALAECVARPSLASKELVDRTLLRLLLGGAAATSSVAVETVAAQLRALGVALPQALSDVATRRLSRLDPEESAAEDELDAFY
jgi:hypothetical protein